MIRQKGSLRCATMKVFFNFHVSPIPIQIKLDFGAVASWTRSLAEALFSAVPSAGTQEGGRLARALQTIPVWGILCYKQGDTGPSQHKECMSSNRFSY